MSSSKILRDKHGAPLTNFSLEDMTSRQGNPDDLALARQKAEKLINDARARKESIEMEAYREGLNKGQAEGKHMAIKRLEPMTSTLKNLLDDLESLREHLTEQHLGQILEIILLIAEKVINREVHTSPDIIIDTLKAASKHLMETDEVTVRLHPSDYEYIREIEEVIKARLTGNKSIHYVQDATVERGGVIIETDLGDIDATIRSQIEHIRETLLEGQ